MPVTRYFHLTAGNDPGQAIRSVEARGHVVVKSVLLAADSVPVYGICEVSAPAMSDPEPASESAEACRACGVKLPADLRDLCNDFLGSRASARVVKENRQGGPKDDRERGV